MKEDSPKDYIIVSISTHWDKFNLDRFHWGGAKDNWWECFNGTSRENESCQEKQNEKNLWYSLEEALENFEERRLIRIEIT